MQTQIKQRIIGGVVILIVLILFLPVLFHKQRPVVQSLNQGATNGQQPSNQTSQVTDNQVVSNTQSIELKLPVKTTAPLQQRVPAAQASLATQPVVQPKSVPTQKQTNQAVTGMNKRVVIMHQNTAPATTVTASPKSTAVPVVAKKVTTNVKNSGSLKSPKTTASKITKPLKSKNVVAQKSLSRVNMSNNMLVPAEINTSAAWVLQVASFTNAVNADRLVSLLRSKGYSAYIRKSSLQNGKRLARVFVGPEIHKAQLKKWQAQIKSDLGVSGFIKKYKI